MTYSKRAQNYLTSTMAVTAAIGLLSLSANTTAAECPAAERGPHSMRDAPTTGKDIKVDVLAQLDLGKEAPHLQNRDLRLRTITFQPGGYVPLHSHDDRPAIAIVTQGELIEHTPNCKVPIVHHVGDIIRENKGVSHWVENTGTTSAVLTVSDIPDNRITDSPFK
ncbi:Uncharacterised protein [BD1-7 clade bacterium]|uniref:Cupin type-2 domain-containing protein n=1 Tax=BD1-7 clade bacterium TaxID=2029982 RepID=A0A5S9R1Q0_9GAMM|nr:Uncharacterised protein [BD1-7 clade bacterium]